MAAVLGVDVSEWQPPELIDYGQLVANGVRFAIVRLADAISTGNDEAAPQHIARFKAQGIPVFGYWFCRDNHDPLVQAKHFADLADSLGVLPIPDYEKESRKGGNVRTWLPTVMQYLDERYRRPMAFYAGWSMLADDDWLGNLPELTRYIAWVPGGKLYNHTISMTAAQAAPLEDPPGYRIGIWQFTQYGRLPGYEGNLDLNIADEAVIAQLAGGAPMSVPLTPAGQPWLTYGIRDSSVAWLTGQLAAKGVPIPVTDFYDWPVAEAIADLQRQAGYWVSGECDDETWGLINSILTGTPVKPWSGIKPQASPRAGQEPDLAPAIVDVAAKVIADALSFEGLTERGSSNVVYLPDGRTLGPAVGANWMDGQPWCLAFVNFILDRHGVARTNSYYCPTALNMAQGPGTWGTQIPEPRPGAVMFITFSGGSEPDHVGFVVQDNGDGTVHTIEGNTSSGNAGSQTNGGGVWQRNRAKSLCWWVWPTGYGAPGAAPVVPDTSAPAGNVIRQGDLGPAVEKLHRQLSFLGYPVDAGNVFGSITAASVGRYQASRGITVDGWVGAITWNRLDADTARPAPGVVVPMVRTPGTGQPWLTAGVEDDSVRWLTSQLAVKGVQIPVTRYYDWAVAGAIAALQSQHGYWASGETDDETWGLVNSVLTGTPVKPWSGQRPQPSPSALERDRLLGVQPAPAPEPEPTPVTPPPVVDPKPVDPVPVPTPTPVGDLAKAVAAELDLRGIVSLRDPRLLEQLSDVPQRYAVSVELNLDQLATAIVTVLLGRLQR